MPTRRAGASNSACRLGACLPALRPTAKAAVCRRVRVLSQRPVRPHSVEVQPTKVGQTHPKIDICMQDDDVCNKPTCDPHCCHKRFADTFFSSPPPPTRRRRERSAHRRAPADAAPLGFTARAPDERRIGYVVRPHHQRARNTTNSCANPSRSRPSQPQCKWPPPQSPPQFPSIF